MGEWFLCDKVFLITGGARGIGEATARKLHLRGAKLALVDLDEEALEPIARRLGALAIVADITDLDAMEAAAARTAEEYGGIDVVWANAGISSFGPLATTDPAAFRRTIEVNVVGTFHTVRAALPYVRPRRGYVAITASAASFSQAPGMSAYAATKAGVEAMANSLRLELHPDGVAVGTIHPIWIDTDMVREADGMSTAFDKLRAGLPAPLRRVHPVSKAADAIVEGFENRSRRVFVPGWMRLMHWTRAAAHSAAGDRSQEGNVPAVLAAFEDDVRAQGGIEQAS